MQKKQVAVLDFGSSQITAVVAERGINKTFIIKGRYSFDYDGYADGEFFNTDKLSKVLKESVWALKRTLHGKIDTVYVGVPGQFTKVLVKESQISFENKKKISEEDIDALFDAAFVLPSSKYTLINRSAIVYELDDCRRLANPYGVSSEILKGKLSFVLCSNYFIETVTPVLKNAGVENVECISTPLAEAMYLVDAESRDRIAIVVDVGYIASTFSIVQGDGILYQRSFSYGGGYISGAISDKYLLDFSVAENLKRKVNLSSELEENEVIEGDNGNYYSVSELKAIILNSLDNLCEEISNSLDGSGYNLPDYVPLFITGGGITYLRGAKEHVSDRLNMTVRVLSPKVPMMNKPSESSLLSLLNLGLEQN